MKKSEIALIILIVSIVAFSTYMLVNTFAGKSVSEPVKVEKADPILAEIKQPSGEVFSKQGINPTVKVKIGDQSNQQPFTINQ